MRPRHLNVYLTLLLSMLLLPVLVSRAMAQGPLPVITAAQADVATRRLVINGSAFGSIQPPVSLAGNQLTISSFTDKQIVAVLPHGLNGDYLVGFVKQTAAADSTLVIQKGSLTDGTAIIDLGTANPVLVTFKNPDGGLGSFAFKRP